MACNKTKTISNYRGIASTTTFTLWLSLRTRLKRLYCQCKCNFQLPLEINDKIKGREKKNSTHTEPELQLNISVNALCARCTAPFSILIYLCKSAIVQSCALPRRHRSSSKTLPLHAIRCHVKWAIVE